MAASGRRSKLPAGKCWGRAVSIASIWWSTPSWWRSACAVCRSVVGRDASFGNGLGSHLGCGDGVHPSRLCEAAVRWWKAPGSPAIAWIGRCHPAERSDLITVARREIASARFTRLAMTVTKLLAGRAACNDRTELQPRHIGSILP